MSVRFTADAQTLNRTVSLGSQAAFSVACWLRVITDRNTYSCVWSLDAGSSADAYVLMTNADGVTLGVWDETAIRGSRVLTVGTWYFAGVSINGANGTLVTRALSDTSFTVSTWSTGSTATNQSTLRIGKSPNASEFLNGAVAAWKWWGTNLTQAELENEAFTYLPQRTANLRAWYPLTAVDTVDYSGNGATLSGGSGAATEDGPGIAWTVRRPALYNPRAVQGWGVPA